MHLDYQFLGEDCFLLLFCKFVTALWPLIDVRISFLLNIIENIDRILPNIIYDCILTRSRLGLL